MKAWTRVTLYPDSSTDPVVSTRSFTGAPADLRIGGLGEAGDLTIAFESFTDMIAFGRRIIDAAMKACDQAAIAKANNGDLVRVSSATIKEALNRR